MRAKSTVCVCWGEWMGVCSPEKATASTPVDCRRREEQKGDGSGEGGKAGAQKKKQAKKKAQQKEEWWGEKVPQSVEGEKRPSGRRLPGGLWWPSGSGGGG